VDLGEHVARAQFHLDAEGDEILAGSGGGMTSMLAAACCGSAPLAQRLLDAHRALFP
jgi:hypothetical protein